MSLFSFHFLVFLAVLYLLYQRSRAKRYRWVLLSVANLVFLSLLLPDMASAAGLAVFLLVSFLMLHLMRAYPSRVWPPVFISLVVAALIYLKRYAFLDAILPARFLEHPLELVGLSYMTFKLIHMMVDLHQGQLPPFSLASYVNYQIGFFSLIAGPIQRYRDFNAFWHRMDAGSDSHQGIEQWNRILSGMIKLGILAFAARYTYNIARDELVRAAAAPKAMLSLLAVFYLYPVYVYLNFAGYCDVVIGSAGLLGMKHQENFNRPYLARNMVDFWNRWHISLSIWIRDYIFTAPYRWAASRWGSRASKVGYLISAAALFLAGLWHGSTWNFALFGLAHAVGVVATQVYGDTLSRLLGRARYKSYMAHPWVRRTAVIATFHYVCFTFLFFSPDLNATARMLETAARKVL